MKRLSQTLLSSMLSLSLVSGMVPVAMAAETDIDSHWAKEALQTFIAQGHLYGSGGGIYRPDNAMTRAEFAAIINRVMGFETQSSKIAQYTDVSADAWYYADMAKALAAGYLSGTSATTLSPNDFVTREQAFTMIARLLERKGGDVTILDGYADGALVSLYARSSVSAMVEEGYVVGTDNRL